MPKALSPSQRQITLRLDQETRPALPPDTHEAAIAALADLLLEALESSQNALEAIRRSSDDL